MLMIVQNDIPVPLALVLTNNKLCSILRKGVQVLCIEMGSDSNPLISVGPYIENQLTIGAILLRDTFNILFCFSFITKA